MQGLFRLLALVGLLGGGLRSPTTLRFRSNWLEHEHSVLLSCSAECTNPNGALTCSQCLPNWKEPGSGCIKCATDAGCDTAPAQFCNTTSGTCTDCSTAIPKWSAPYLSACTCATCTATSAAFNTLLCSRQPPCSIACAHNENRVSCTTCEDNWKPDGTGGCKCAAAHAAMSLAVVRHVACMDLL